MSGMILKLKPVLQEKIWGGDRLNTVFGYDIPSGHTGECWAISGHPGGDCPVENPAFAGETLGSPWRKRRDLFGNVPGDIYPLLVKIIDAREDLSIQVHPDDAYAAAHENGALGKTECWYVLDCGPDTNIVIGHHAASKAEMARMVEEDRWDELLRQVPIHRGDFFQIEPGCLHAIKGGTLILETQQSSDVTYRFYDYGRLQDGKPRQLHIAQSLDVTRAPFRPAVPERETWRQGDAVITRLVKCPYYTVYHGEVDGELKLDLDAPFVNLSVLAGQGTLDGQPVAGGDHMVLTADYGRLAVRGRLELIWSHI